VRAFRHAETAATPTPSHAIAPKRLWALIQGQVGVGGEQINPACNPKSKIRSEPENVLLAIWQPESENGNFNHI